MVTSDHIELLVRSVSYPYPGAYTFLRDKKILIWRATEFKSRIKIYGVPGQIMYIPDENSIVIVCNNGALVIEEASDIEGLSVMDILRKSANQRCQMTAA